MKRSVWGVFKDFVWIWDSFSLLTNLVISIIDDIILQEFCRYLQFNKESCQVCSFLQLGDSLQQPVKDWVDHGFAANNQTLSKTTPTWNERKHNFIYMHLHVPLSCTCSQIFFLENYFVSEILGLLGHIKRVQNETRNEEKYNSCTIGGRTNTHRDTITQEWKHSWEPPLHNQAFKPSIKLA